MREVSTSDFRRHEERGVPVIPIGSNMGSLLSELVVLIALALAAPVHAQDSKTMMAGADFLLACSGPDSEWIGFCRGYVQAVVDGVRLPGEGFCGPEGTTRAEIVGAVADQLTQMQQLNAASAVYCVLVKTYPCR